MRKVIVIALVLYAAVIFATVKANSQVGAPCDWASDCDLDEVCVSVKEGWYKPRICLPKE